MESEVQFWQPKLGEEFTIQFLDVPPRWVGPSGQRQCEYCGKFLRRLSKDEQWRSLTTSEWKCIDMGYDSYYDAWEHG